jgi:hypothetical protein
MQLESFFFDTHPNASLSLYLVDGSSSSSLIQPLVITTNQAEKTIALAPSANVAGWNIVG